MLPTDPTHLFIRRPHDGESSDHYVRYVRRAVLIRRIGLLLTFSVMVALAIIHLLPQAIVPTPP